MTASDSNYMHWRERGDEPDDDWSGYSTRVWYSHAVADDLMRELATALKWSHAHDGAPHTNCRYCAALSRYDKLIGED